MVWWLVGWGLALALGGAVPELPVVHLQAARQVAVQVRPVGTCGTRPVVELFLVINGREFVLLVTPERFLLGDNADGEETDVWVGRLAPDGALVAQAYMTFREVRQRYPTVCDALLGRLGGV